MIKEYVNWIEVEQYCGTTIAKLELINPIEIDGKLFSEIICSLEVPNTHQVMYKFADGSSATKMEVKSWGFVLWNQLNTYRDANKQEFDKLKMHHEVDHANVKSISFLDKNKKVLYKKINNQSVEVNYKIVNDEFDQEYADQYNWGDPGPGNLKYHDTWKYKIENVGKIIQNKNVNLNVIGVDEFDSTHNFEVANLFQFRCELNDGDFEDFYVSNSIIRNIHMTNDKGQNARFYFYIKTDQAFIMMDDTTFVAAQEIPEQMRKTVWKSITFGHNIKSKLIERSGSMAGNFQENNLN